MSVDPELARRVKTATFRRVLRGAGALPQRSRVLDCVAATGFAMDVALEQGHQPYGVELSSFGAGEIARRFGASRVFCGQLEDATFDGTPDGSFAAVFMLDYLEHVRDPLRVLRRAHALLQPGGLLAITTPKAGSWSHALLGRRWGHYKLEHLHYFTSAALRRLLARAGFTGHRERPLLKNVSLGYATHHLRAYPQPGVGGVVRLLARVTPAGLQRRTYPPLPQSHTRTTSHSQSNDRLHGMPAGLVLCLALSLSAVEPPPARTGWGVQGLPLLNYNSDDGVGYGARLMLVDRGDGTDAPYRHAITGQFFQTTGGVGLHKLIFDAPRVFGSDFRLDFEVTYGIEKFTSYYGLDGAAFAPEHASCADRAALAANPDVCPGNDAFLGYRYYAYGASNLPRASLNLRRALGGPWRVYGGYRLRVTTIDPAYSPEELGQTRPSRLVEDARAGLVVGYDGASTEPFTQTVGELAVGVLFDTRDNEPAPTRGMFHELSARLSASPLGSQFDYWGVTTQLRFYLPLISGPRPLVAGARLLSSVTEGAVPFYQLSSHGTLENRDTFGGLLSVRGLWKNRYLGKVKQIVNTEVRWTPLSVEPWGQRFAFTLVGAVDGGRVWPDLRFGEGGGSTVTAALGLRAAWNENFIVRLDYGRALTEPSTGFYIDFNHMF